MGGMSSSVVVGQPRLFLLAATIATAGSILMSAPIRGQEQSIATPADTIMARKTVMDTLSDKMDAIELMISSNKIDLKTGQDNANDISVYMMAFPLLFPAATNQWKPNATHDPIADTFAAPDVWTKFPDFYRQAAAASRAAFTASRAQNDADFKAAITQLRADCNACHTVYLKTD
jgi:cytochrome c556